MQTNEDRNIVYAKFSAVVLGVVLLLQMFIFNRAVFITSLLLLIITLVYLAVKEPKDESL